MMRIKRFRDRVLAAVMFVFAFFRLTTLPVSAQQSGAQNSQPVAGLTIGPVVNTQTVSEPQALISKSVPAEVKSLLERSLSCDCSCSCSCDCGCGCC